MTSVYNFFVDNSDRVPKSFSAWRHRIVDLWKQIPNAYSNYQIQMETLEALNRDGYSLNGTWVELETTLDDFTAVTKNVAPQDDIKDWKVYKGEHETVCQVKNDDCILATLSLLDDGFNPVMLNMANPFHPGGSYKRGASAQEENIFRRTNLADLIDSTRGKQRLLHPINRGEAIYCPRVQVFRGTSSEQYALFPKPRTIAIMCSAAVRDPKTVIDENGNRHLNERDSLNTKRIIYAQFETAMKNGHDTFVSGAFGCGGFNNPPEDIANTYRFIQETFFSGVFKKIVFPIVSSYNENAQSPNFMAFDKCLAPQQA